MLIEAVKITEFHFRQNPEVDEKYMKRMYHYAEEMVRHRIENHDVNDKEGTKK
ncbi:MAG: hypothetical protein ACJ71R_00015 [Nitrososphaeraceae archaeon]|jgi:hypothetical protein